MGGIAGLFDLRGRREMDRSALRRMTEALAHRGPDGQGTHLAPGVALGHRRLAVTGCEDGKQPMTARRGGTVLTLDGEVYNHRALRPEIERQGRSLLTTCDAEVLAELVDMRGADALTDLTGMFAFGAYDPREDTLLLARDRFGEKPLYWSVTRDDVLVFASEMPAIIASGLVEPLIDEEAVADYLFYGYVPDPGTIYRGVHRLEAGHAMTVRRGSAPRPRRWFRHVQAAEDMDDQEAASSLLALLDEAVQRQRLTDMPLGAFLPGGIDSASIVASMARDGGAPTTCTVGFEGASTGEHEDAERVARLFDTDHHVHLMRLDVESLLPRVAAAYAEPFADGSALPTFMACELTRRHVKVALSAGGADELLAGHARYGRAADEARLRRLMPGPARAATFGPLGKACPRLDFAPRHMRLKTRLQALGEDGPHAYARSVCALPPDRCRALLAEGLRQLRPQRHVERAFAEADTDDPLMLAQAADIATWLPGRMLVKIDRASMAHGLEVRAPFLDHHLAALAGVLPRRQRWDDGLGKRALRAAVADRLPKGVASAPNRGSDAPMGAWLKADGGRLCKSLLARQAWRDSGYFEEATVERYVRDHLRGPGRYGQELWSVLMFDAFLEAA